MPKNKPLETSEVTHIEEMLVNGDEAGMTLEIARKYARVLDMTDSGRDIKPLATGMFEAVERVRSLEVKRAEADNPLNRIMTMAEDA
jgi:hypothetical protein